ncbi:MAG TPA: mechanosensitive ion channel family protein [Stellaceae bacterium]
MHRIGFGQAVLRRAAAIALAAIVLAIGQASGAFAAKPGSSAAAVAAPQEPPAQIRALLTLLGDPAVQKWLQKEGVAPVPAKPPKPKSPTSVSHYLDLQLGETRAHIAGLVAAVPDLPRQFTQAGDQIGDEVAGRGRFPISRLLALFVGLGFGVEALYRMATQRVRRRLDALPVASVGERLRLICERFLFAVGLVAAFAVGSLGAFLAFDWPPLLREIVFGYLVVFVVIRIGVVVSRLLLSPEIDRFRIIPMDGAAARFWSRRLRWFVGWFAFGFVTVGLLRTLGLSLAARELVAYVLGLGLLAIALEAAWRRPAPVPTVEGEAAPRHPRRGTQNVLLSVGFVVLWLLWVAKLMPSFWLLLIIIVLPLASVVTRRTVDHLLRPPGTPQVQDAIPSVTAVCIERGMRAVLIIAAVAVLAWGWGIPLDTITGEDTMAGRLVHGALSAVIIFLIADVLWQATKAAIDRKLAGAADPGVPNTDEARRRARLRTLLPIFRNVLFVVVIVVAAMMALSAMGVEIGPLIAGAGVIGVAIGFGAQSLVRDVIAGVFYLLDDAFRVGEYIQSGNYKGTVESFSFRSVRLRHQRGALYTVPFALLGAVQNQSRDWVIDKMTVGITYDSDVDKARKIIKQIGLELAQDPEFAPLIIEPLKMQGVDALGDFAVQIRMKMMTLPGENFVIRRKALAMIKQQFTANGIKFAFPTVQIASEAEPMQPEVRAAVAQRGLELAQPPAKVA